MTVATEVCNAASILGDSIERDYREIVCRLAVDDDMSVKDLRKSLMAAGRTPDNLKADVSAVRQRRAWADAVAAADEAKQAQKAARQQKAEVEAELEKLAAEHRARTAPLRQQRARLEQAAYDAMHSSHAGGALHDLRRTASPALLAEIEHCTRRSNQLKTELAGAKRSVAEAEAIVAQIAAMRNTFEEFKAGNPANLFPHPPWLRRGFFGPTDVQPKPVDCDLAAIEHFITEREQAADERLRAAKHAVDTLPKELAASQARHEKLERDVLDWRNFAAINV